MDKVTTAATTCKESKPTSMPQWCIGAAPYDPAASNPVARMDMRELVDLGVSEIKWCMVDTQTDAVLVYFLRSSTSAGLPASKWEKVMEVLGLTHPDEDIILPETKGVSLHSR